MQLMKRKAYSSATVNLLSWLPEGEQEFISAQERAVPSPNSLGVNFVE